VEEMICVSELSYSGRLGAPLKNLSFSIEKGGIHGILSPGGVEASTLLAILAGSIVGADGSLTIHLGDEDSEKAKQCNRRKRKIGYVPKTPEVYRDMTVFEFLDFVGEARGCAAELRLRQIEEALDLVGLSDKENRLFERLSAVQKKKVSLAAALLGNPSVLLIDEPIPAGANAADQREIAELIRMLGKLKTIVLAGESLSTMREFCEDVVLLSGGELLAKGSFAELEENLARSEEKISLDELYASLVSLAKESELTKKSLLSEPSKKEAKK
jgi:ABC-2 type transport system ATP-binding protein